jgi:phosphoserine phosphatase RsbU/P
MFNQLIELAEQLLLQPDLGSQLGVVINAFERLFSCKARLWIADSYIATIMDKSPGKFDQYLNILTELMMQASIKKQIIPDNSPVSNSNDLPLFIAIPLMCKDEVLAVIQLERDKTNGFRSHEIEYLSGVAYQASLVLNLKRQESICSEKQTNNEMHSTAAQIVKSINSILDIENLLNNIISLLHQKFGFSKVNIFLVRGNENKNISKVGISQLGIEPIRTFFFEQDDSSVLWSVIHREIVIINDTNQEHRFSPSSFDTSTKSEMIIPLDCGDLFIGVIDICSDVVNRFDTDLSHLLCSLSENIALAIRNARLYQSEQIGRQITQRLNEVIGKISADISYDEVLHKILVELEKILPCDISAIWLFDNSSSETGVGQFTSSLKIKSLYVKDLFISYFDQNLSINISEIKNHLLAYENEPGSIFNVYPWLLEIISTRRPSIRSSDEVQEPLGDVSALPAEYSAIAIPIYNNDQFMGIIISAHHQPHLYTDESILIAAYFANFLSVVIENNRLFAAAHDQVWITTVMQQVTEATQSTDSLGELVDTVNNLVIDLVGISGCTLYLWDQSADVFFPQASKGFDEEQQDRLNSWDIFQETLIAFDQLVQERRPVILNSDSLSDDLISLIFPTRDLQSNLLLLFPMIAQDNLIGALLIDFTNTLLANNPSQKLWDDMYALIEGVSHQAAIAINNIQMIKSREEEAYISIALLQVAQAIVSLNQLDEILASIVRITPILVGVKRCIIYLWDSKEMVFHQAQYFGFSKSDINIEDQVIKSDEYPFLQLVVKNNQVAYHQLGFTISPLMWKEIKLNDLHILEGITLDNNYQFTINLDNQALREKARLLIGFPLSVKGEVLAVMLIEEEDPVKGSPSYHIREKRIEIVKGITQQAAVAIKNELLQQEAVNSERMERELQLAREIQKTFLPDHLPTFIGWDMDIRWQPARQVAGDFYDILPMDGNKLGFVIADVADKGMPAALFMILIRTLIRAAAKEYTSPAAVLKQVNALLVPDTKNGMFVTVFYTVIDLDSGKITYANAGHNPPIVRFINSDGLVELNRTSIALGIFDDIEVEEGEISLRPGDWLFFYTDGVTEAFSFNDEMFGTKRLSNLLLGKKYTSSKEILNEIEGAVFEFIKGTELSDDITLAAMYYSVS